MNLNKLFILCINHIIKPVNIKIMSVTYSHCYPLLELNISERTTLQLGDTNLILGLTEQGMLYNKQKQASQHLTYI
jgi:hypothetical protein